jgi:predicted ferric reductase
VAGRMSDVRHRVSAALLYLGATLVPLFVVLADHGRPQRGFWIEFAVALGFIGLAMLCAQSILTARFPRVSGTLGQDALLQFHRQAGILAFLFVLAHPVILVAADSGYWAFLDPRAEFLRALFLILVLIALPLIVITALWREPLRLPYEWWRLSHGVLALGIVGIGLVHVWRVGFYLESGWKQALWAVIGVTAIGSVLYLRAIKPLRVRRYPYRVSSVEPAAARTWEVTVEPESPPALGFDAGQFAFLTVSDNPFSLQQHPFSIASSTAQRDRLEFAIKELGDFTNRIGSLQSGGRAYVDGPYGSLRLREGLGAGLMAVAGGIGITPVISMLRTLRDQQSARPVVLIYASNRIEELAFADELAEMESLLDLRVVHVLADPPSGWEGETGLLTPELIQRYAPTEQRAEWRYVLCGPPPMMEIAESALLDLGVPLGRIESERFDIGAAGVIGRRHARIRRSVVALAGVLLAAAVLFAT